ncbi:hypothetical protein KCV06_g411, partial [Aureobasidium melanogenum]
MSLKGQEADVRVWELGGVVSRRVRMSLAEKTVDDAEAVTGGFSVSEDRLIPGTSGSSESVFEGLEIGSSGTTIIGISALMTESGWEVGLAGNEAVSSVSAFHSKQHRTERFFLRPNTLADLSISLRPTGSP